MKTATLSFFLLTTNSFHKKTKKKPTKHAINQTFKIGLHGLTIISYGTFLLVYVHTNSLGVAFQEQKAKTCPTKDRK